MSAIENKIAIVTGGGGGIGGAIVRCFAREGASSPLWTSIPGSAKSTASESLNHGTDAIPIVADVTKNPPSTKWCRRLSRAGAASISS